MTSLEETMHENTLKTNQTVEPRNDCSSIADLSIQSSTPFQPYQKRFSMSLACQSTGCSDKVIDSDVQGITNKCAVSENLPVTGESKTYLSNSVSSDADISSLGLPSVESSSQLSSTSNLQDTQRSRMSVELSSVALPVSGGERIGNRPVSCDRMSEQSPTHSPAISPNADCSRSPVGPDNSPASGSSVLEVKRARVETIVSTMMQCPSGPVNGCKKRKLYQPQQHEVNEDEELEGDNEEDNEEFSGPPIKQRRVFQEDLKSDLRKMQEQLALIEQQYTELFQEHVSPSQPMVLKTEKKPLQSGHFGERDTSLVMLTGVNSKVTDNIQSRKMKDTISEARQLADHKDQKIRQSCIVKPNGQTSQTSMTTDLDNLVDALKSEISRSLTNVIDSIVTKYKQTRVYSKSLEAETPKDLTLLSQILDQKSPRTKVVDRGNRVTSQMPTGQKVSPFSCDSNTRTQDFYSQGIRPPTSLFCPTTSSQAIHFAPASNIPYLPAGTGVTTSSCVTEQTEAISLVVTPKKRRHKVTDARVTSRLMSHSTSQEDCSPKHPFITNATQPSICLPVYPHQPPPLVPVSLPTSVAIPNPSLHHNELFPYCYETTRLAYFSQEDKSSLAGRAYSHYPDSPVESTAFSYLKQDLGDGSDGGDSQSCESSLAVTSTLTPMHLRKAKLMFFYVRYPSSTVLKLYFQDIKFNKNNTAQLTKWFSNFREFFYIQMEKFSRQAISEGVKSSENLKIGFDSELVRILNLHYNRNNHIEVPEHFRYVVEQALREFFKAISTGKDQEQSWKKTVYKVIARLDTNVPEYFKNPNFMEQLE